jgi:DNA replication protein DnaD
MFIGTFGRIPSPYERTDARYYLQHDMTEDVLCAAIRAAADAPRPTWRYAVAVLARCLSEGVLDAEGFARRSRQHAERREEKPAQVNFQRYTQRVYSKAEMERLIEPI